MEQEKIRLLLVDDELEFLESTTKALTRRGFIVGTAQDGETALRIMCRQPYDVVVLDVKMPGLDGVDVFRQIHHLYPHIPAILLTGHGTIQQAFETSREGVFEYLGKPCDMEVIADTVRRAYHARSEPPPPEPQGEERVRLLLVDDEPELLDSLSRALTRRGIDVTAAGGGSEALRHLASITFDVALIDAKMPGMDGIALLRMIKKAQPLTEVLVLTGHPSMGMAVDGLREGASDFLMKPQNPDVLATRIHEAYRMRKVRLRLQQQNLAQRAIEGKAD